MRIRLDSALMLSDILNALNVTVTNAQSDAEITHITTSSKECFKGDLFVALVGARHNGNDYVGEVLSLGAYAICARRIEGAYFVEDTALALLKIANLYKNRLKHFKKLIAITGSVGKSSTKELTAELLKGKYKTHRSAGNENNIIGVSYTLLCAPSDTEIIVAEVGMNHKGEIRAISKIISPDISVITNVGTAHIGNLGSREAIASAKLEILSGMGFHGRLLVDGDEPLLDGYGAISVSSESGECDAFMHVIELTSERSVCDFYYGESIIYNLSFLPLGKHMLKNLAFAVLISMLLKMNESEIKDAISKISADIFRQKMISVANFSVLDDSYNASVEALKSMLDYLMLFSGRRKSLVFSEILELGDMADLLHERLGRLIAAYPLNTLYLVGSKSEQITRAAIYGGFPSEHIFTFTSLFECAECIMRMSEAGEIVLIKGSHATGLSRLTEILKSKGQDYA